MTLTIKFKFEKETKGAVRYQEVGDNGEPAFSPSVGSLYVRVRTHCYVLRNTGERSNQPQRNCRQAERTQG
jgi:hypothetical protein